MVCLSPLPPKIPILEIKLKIVPVLGVVGGLIFSCSNYFHVILHGGVGKNGSTIAVRQYFCHLSIVIRNKFSLYKKIIKYPKTQEWRKKAIILKSLL